jgi:ABC-type sugar transport system substrate-binding protein
VKTLLFLFSILVSPYVFSKNIVFVNPSVPGVAFWDRVTKISLAAARDLDLTVEVVYGEDNRITHFETLTNVASRENKPDLVIFMPYGGNAKYAYELFENAMIPFVTMERTLEKQEAQTLGSPGEHFKYWYGEVFHDNENAGKRLADSIIEYGYKVFNKKKLSLAALTGSFSGESSHRNDGLLASIAEHPDIKLLQIVPANWSRERGKAAIHKLINRYKHVDLVWSASDSMALGVLDSLKAKPHEQRPKVVIGGFDWTQEAIKEIQQGNIHASVGGHIFQGAWTLVFAKDLLFDKVSKYKSISYSLEVIDTHNISKFQILSTNYEWDAVDFNQFRLRDEQLETEYLFGFDSVLSQIK